MTLEIHETALQIQQKGSETCPFCDFATFGVKTHPEILPARQSVASPCALISIVTQYYADIQCDFTMILKNI